MYHFMIYADDLHSFRANNSGGRLSWQTPI
jgi:hypothetical protein